MSGSRAEGAGIDQAPVKYSTIVADPPWPYKGSGPWGNGGTVRPGKMQAKSPSASSVAKYGSMSMDALKALSVPSADAAHLYLWTTNAFMVQAHDLARAWGFEPKTILTWTKTHKTDGSRVSMKTGYYYRGATEHCLFCVKGRLRLNDSTAYPTGFLWARLPHSVKPDEFFGMVEQASPGPYLEMFARRPRDGWHHWGNEFENDVELTS